MKIDVKTIANMLYVAEGLAPKKMRPAPTSPNYPVFLHNTRASDNELENERRFFDKHRTELPIVSVLMDASGVLETDVNSTVISLVAQTYGNWELVMGVDLSYPHADKFKGSENIKLVMCADNAMKWIQEETRGDYLLMLRAGDRLSPDALFKLTAQIKDASLIFADNDIDDEKGERRSPRFKPSYSPVSVYCYDVIGRPMMVTKTLHKRVGGLNGADSASYRKYVLDCCKKAGRTAHIPEILLSEKNDNEEIEVVNMSPGNGLTVIRGSFEGSGRIASAIVDKRTTDIIIGNPDSVTKLRRCMEAIDTLCVDKYRSIIISVCGDMNKDLMRYLEILNKNKAASIVWDRKRSAVLPAAFNLGASHSFADSLIFMAPDTEIATPEFIEELTTPLRINGVGVSGGKLIDENGRLLHTGTVIGIHGWADSLYSGEEDDMADETKCFFTAMQRNVSAVSGAFMAVDAEELCSAGMFDESFGNTGWDAEFCLRAAKKGTQTVFTPFAKAIYHGELPSYESASRSVKIRCYDAFRNTLLEGDLFYSPNYDHRRNVPMLAIEPAKPIKLNPLF